MQSLPSDSTFEPLMTLYLTDVTTPEEIRKAHATGFIKACKYYPAGATTNSQYGVTDVKKTYPALRAMADVGMVLCIHSEVTGPQIDIFDREGQFIDEIMTPLVADFPTLQIVMEHISTEEAVDYIVRPVQRRRDHHVPSSAVQSQRPPRRRGQAALLLPPHSEARDASAGFTESRHVGQSQILCGDRFGTARHAHQGDGMWLRGGIHGARCRGAVRRGL